MVFSLAEVAGRLAGRVPVQLADDSRTPAAVALLLRSGGAGLEVLFIERAPHGADPWSGDLGFPGGKVEAGDGEPRRAAERETWEELGIELERARYLGHLAEIAGAHLPIRVSCFVYGIETAARFILSEEIRDVFWVPLAALADPQRQLMATVHFQGEPLERPAILLPIPGKPVLWGITYRLVRQFLELFPDGA